MPLFDRRWLIRLLNLYPPYLGAGVCVRASADLRTFDVRMKLRRWNRNYVGTHFGGSLYSMCDPFYMLILVEQLGRDYIVWDKAGAIRYVKPGRGTVYARFRLDAAAIEHAREATAGGDKHEPTFSVDVVDAANTYAVFVMGPERIKLEYVEHKPTFSLT